MTYVQPLILSAQLLTSLRCRVYFGINDHPPGIPFTHYDAPHYCCRRFEILNVVFSLYGPAGLFLYATLNTHIS
ncbi:hypothetical protein BD779DRAFT_584569 [Infundibulicybe gibba]|nr:hypothetical protein BD779DRAFT_584569 [Infundibulicybe gibba]